jgi:hypothetical protein
VLPRQRARDQQADLAGLQLKRRILDRLAALDPEPADLEGALIRIVEEFGEPTGPDYACRGYVNAPMSRCPVLNFS